MCAEINYLIPLLLLLHYEVKVVHQVLGWIIYFFNTGTLFEMSTCHLNFFHLWHNGTFFCHILWVKNGSGKTREMRTRGQKWKKKKKGFIYFYLLHKCLVGWGTLLVCENHWLIYTVHGQKSQANGAKLCFKVGNDCNVYIFVCFVQCKYDYF